MTGSAELNTFFGAKARCCNSTDPAYKDYGGRGIKFNYPNFDSFYDDLGPRPSPEHSIDRIDVNGNYEPGNCRWATRTEQAINKRNTIYVKIDEEQYVLRLFFGEKRKQYITCFKRIFYGRWPVKTAIFWDKREKWEKRKASELIEPMSFKECVEVFGIPRDRAT